MSRPGMEELQLRMDPTKESFKCIRSKQFCMPRFIELIDGLQEPKSETKNEKSSNYSEEAMSAQLC